MKIKWNPIHGREDLPKSNKQVLVTFRYRGRSYVEINQALPKYMRSEDDDVCWEEYMFDIIAWAELPEPYVEKGETK